MFFTVYKITNLINEKIYIGKHQTKYLDDGYMGSGKILKHAISKYGIENFHKEILFVFNNEAEMNAKEAELVVVSENTYNLCDGGKGGFGFINKNKLNLYESHKENSIRNLQSGEEQRKKYYESGKHKSKMKSVINKWMQEKYPEGVWIGRKHTEETKHKMRKSKGKGFKNSQYGTCWITNGKENKKIKKDIDFIPEGWYKGRVTV